eukprot:612255-Prorocentrum_minimum.AAC.5
MAGGGVSDLGLGCGNPLSFAAIAPGETVLDLGSGAGFDAFLAGRAAGPAGKVIGVDMTPEMLAKAEENAQAGLKGSQGDNVASFYGSFCAKNGEDALIRGYKHAQVGHKHA